MFRPSPSSSRLRLIPIRQIVSLLMILGLMVSILILFTLEHDKFVLQGIMEGQNERIELFPALWEFRRDLIMVGILVFLLSAIAVTAVITYLHYDSTRHTLEEVKGIARNILEGIPTGVLTVNRDGLVTAINPIAAQLLQRTSGGPLGQPYKEALQVGDTIRALLDRALLSQSYVQNEDVYYPRADRHGRTIRATTAPLAGDDGQPAGVILQIVDVTEFLALKQRIRLAEKLEALHTLSAGVAHELRNPLSAVDLNLQLLSEELEKTNGLTGNVARYLQIVEAETRRLGTILDNFLKFSHPATISQQFVNLREILAHIVSLFQFEVEERGICFETAFPEELPGVRGEETQVSQMLVNIVVNAIQAMPEGGTCRIAAKGYSETGKEWVEISVCDTGRGIKPEDLSRLFDPFFTTKQSGTGLGLAVAYRIADNHGGMIRVHSKPNHGTTVAVTLPATGNVQPAEQVGL